MIYSEDDLKRVAVGTLHYVIDELLDTVAGHVSLQENDDMISLQNQLDALLDNPTKLLEEAAKAYKLNR